MICSGAAAERCAPQEHPRCTRLRASGAMTAPPFCWYGLYARPWDPPTGAHPAPGLGPAEGVHSPGCPPPNAPRSSAMPADSLEHANTNHTKKGQTGLDRDRPLRGRPRSKDKTSVNHHMNAEWGEPLPIQAASPIGEVGARQLSPPSITSTLSAANSLRRGASRIP